MNDMTKKELVESLKNVPDDAVILAVDCWKSGIRYGAYWGSDNEFEFIENIMQDAKYVPLSNHFKLSDYIDKPQEFNLELAKKIVSGEISGKIETNGNYPITIISINEKDEYPITTEVINLRGGKDTILYDKNGAPIGNWKGFEQNLHLTIKIK